MKRLMTVVLCVFALGATAVAYGATKKQTMPDWQNPQVVQQNRIPMSARFDTDGLKLMLNGIWNFNWNEDMNARPTDFYSLQYDDSAWDTIPVPGMWELNGYGDPVYLNIGYAWKGHYANNPPYPADWHNYVGQYRRNFVLDEDWEGKDVFLHIGSATSNVRVWINGKEVGYSEDSKLEARFNITKYVKTGENLIALEIFRWCDGTYLEDQDFWRLSGISRDVYVYSREKKRIEDINVQASASGEASLRAEVSKGVTEVTFEILDPKGESVASAKVPVVKNVAETVLTVQDVLQWSAETPWLYTLNVASFDKKGQTEEASIEIGFRDVRDRGRPASGKRQACSHQGCQQARNEPVQGICRV